MTTQTMVPVTDVSQLPPDLPVLAASLRYPTETTLKKHGLSHFDYAHLFFAQQGRCAICHNPLNGRTNIDHQHGIRGWKKLSPEKRKMYVRGILCWTCNHLIVGRGVTTDRLWNAYNYLRKFEARVTAESPVKQEKKSRNMHPTKKGVKRRNIRHTDKK